MPSAAAHIASANIVKNKLNIKDDMFFVGALLPDVLEMDKKESHFKEQGSFFLVPRLNYYKETHDLNNPMNLGYYLHLYLDYYFLEDYLKNNNPGVDVFEEKIIYKDYDILNKKILDRFNVDKDKIIELLNNNIVEGESSKRLSKNIECLNKDEAGDIKVLKDPLFIDFIEKTSLMFIEELDKNV